MTDIINQEYIQWGFAGFAFIMLGIIVWMFKQLIMVVNKNNGVLAKLIDAIKSVENTEKGTAHAVEKFRVDTSNAVDKIESKVDDMREKLISRPCLMRNRD